MNYFHKYAVISKVVAMTKFLVSDIENCIVESMVYMTDGVEQ